MQRTMFTGKIHRATVTHADLDYEGSVTVDRDLLKAAGMLEHEFVHIWNVTRGSRITTYTLNGEAGSGVICINGAAAHHNRPGDLVIISAFAQMNDDEARQHRPRVVLVDSHNKILSAAAREVPGPAVRSASDGAAG